jgi:hypothetical protein
MRELYWHTAPLILNYSRLICGLLMIVVPVFCIFKIRRGSKSTFAYILVLFSMYQGTQDVIRFFVESLRTKYVDPEGQTIYILNFRWTVILNAWYQYLAVQTWIFALKYLESSVRMSINKPLCTPKCIQVTLWAGIAIVTITTWGTMIWNLATFPGQINDDSSAQFEEYLATTYTLTSLISTYPWLTMHVVSTWIQGFAIYKIHSTTKDLKKVEVNIRTMSLHISILLIQNAVMVVCMVFGSVAFVVDDQGYEVTLFGRFDTPLTWVDCLIEMIICYICYTMGSSSQLRRFDCNIQKNK